MNYELRREIHKRRVEIGQHIHDVEIAIYTSRLAIKALRAEEPVDCEAISVQYAAMRAAHARRHQLQEPLERAKEAEAMEYRSSWRARYW